jgi:hypothetical protein
MLMNQDKKAQLKKKTDAELDKMKADIDRLDALLREKKARMKLESQDRLDELRQKTARVHNRLNALKESSDSTWRKTNQEVAEAWHDLEEACRLAAADFRNRQKR